MLKENDQDRFVLDSMKNENTEDNLLYRQIIAVTNRRLCSRPFLQQMERVCSLHPRAVILREKDLEESQYKALAQDVLKICRSYQVPCILHTFYQTARQLGVKNIHLPLPLLQTIQKNGAACSPLTDFDTIGVSVHSVDDAKEALRLGASYVTAGHIFATGCKPGLAPRGLDFLEQVCQAVTIPVYAIGGIKADPAQLSLLREKGAQGGCIMSGMMQR